VTNLMFMEGEPTTAIAMLALVEAGALPLEDDFTDAVHRRASAAGKEHARLNAIGAPDSAHDAVLTAAREGGDIDAAAAFAWQHADEIVHALASYRAMNAAAVLAARDVHRIIRERASMWGADLLDSLRDTLNEADRHARVMVDAEGFSYGDPSSLYDSDKPVRVAFQALTPLARKHDAIRIGSVALWVGTKGVWTGIADLAGSGVVQQRANTLSPPVWRWRPDGHSVARLVAASLEEPSEADEAEADAADVPLEDEAGVIA
jgi:hypothetical protein